MPINTTIVTARTLLHPLVLQPDGGRMPHSVTEFPRRAPGCLIPLSTLTLETDGGGLWPHIGDWQRVLMESSGTLLEIGTATRCHWVFRSCQAALLGGGPSMVHEVHDTDGTRFGSAQLNGSQHLQRAERTRSPLCGRWPLLAGRQPRRAPTRAADHAVQAVPLLAATWRSSSRPQQSTWPRSNSFSIDLDRSLSLRVSFGPVRRSPHAAEAGFRAGYAGQPCEHLHPRPRKRVRGNSSWVQIPPLPPKSLARRGRSRNRSSPRRRTAGSLSQPVTGGAIRARRGVGRAGFGSVAVQLGRRSVWTLLYRRWPCPGRRRAGIRP